MEKNTLRVQVMVFCYLHIQGEEGESMVLWNTGVSPHHWILSQYQRTGLECPTQ